MTTPRLWRRAPDGEIVRVHPEPTSVSTGEPVPEPGSPTQPSASLWLALRLGFRDTYDHLGAVLVMSAATALLVTGAVAGADSAGRALFRTLPGSLPLLGRLLLGLAVLSLAGGPLAAGLFRYCRNAAARQEPELFDLAWGFRQGLRRSLGLAGIQTAASMLLASNCLFYVLQKHPVLVVIGAVFGYAGLFWTLMCLYQWPLLTEQEIGPLHAVRKSALLVLDNPGFSAGLGAALGLLTAAAWASVVGGLLLWAGTSAMFQTQATRELLRKYGVLPPDPTLDPVAAEADELRGPG